MEHRDLDFLLRALDQSNDGVLITDADLRAPGPRILYVNGAYERISGYAAVELVGASPRVLQGRETDRALLDGLKAALGRGESFHGETWNYRKDGTPYRVEWDIAPVRDIAGAVTAYISIQRDVTARFEAEEALRRTTAALRASNDRLRDLGGVLSHDLQEPLTVVRGYLELLRLRHGAALGEDVRYIDTAIAGADRMTARIRGLLAEALRSDAMAEPVDLEAVVRGALDDLAPALAEAAAEVTVDALPAVLALPQELGEVFHNLVSNAVKYRRDDRPLRIGISGCRMHDALVQVAVSDTGRGIAPEDHERIFAPGARALASPDGAAGHGFGLAFVRRAVERCGGKVTVHSRPGRGATFVLTLPAA